jgi:hypothetical protein
MSHGLLIPNFRLVDHYGRLCARFKYTTKKTKRKGPDLYGRLDLYGRFEQEFVDEVVVTLLVVLEQAARKGKWIMDATINT